MEVDTRDLDGDDMSDQQESAQELRKLLDDIDSRFEAIEPVEVVEDETILQHFAKRATQTPALEDIGELATSGLRKFPLCTPLLRLRAEAWLRVVSPEGEFPHLEEAEADLRTILDIDPDHVGAGAQLLNALFVFSGVEDAEVAKFAGRYAEKAERWLADLRALQLEAHGYADDQVGAEALFARWGGVLEAHPVFAAAQARHAELHAGTSSTESSAT